MHISSQKIIEKILHHFLSILEMLNALCEEMHISHEEISGSVSMKKRDTIVQRFQNGEIEVLCCTIASAGVGLTLTKSNHVIIAESDWVPGNLNQAIDRVHRMGQKLPVFIFRMVTKGTIEERIQILKSEKSELFEKAFKEIDTVRDIKEYFSELSNLSLIDNEPANNKKYSLK